MEFMKNEYHSLKQLYLFRARGNLKLIEIFVKTMVQAIRSMVFRFKLIIRILYE